MLTTNDYLNLEDYVFKSSPESCSGNSCFTDCTDLPSDEDFLQQLSSGLDIPLLLNAGEDEMSLLNSFFDKSPEEIMSEIALGEDNFQPKIEPSDSSSSSNNSPVQSPEISFEIKDELKIEPHSPGSVGNVPVHNTEVKFTPPKVTKQIPIQPKVVTSTPNKVVILKNPDGKRSAPSIAPPATKVVVLENVTTIAPILPTTTVTTVPPVVLKTSDKVGLNVGNIDPKILKRQQRKIKNRESACLSRKKKKDYLTSLETQVKDLTTENQQLKLENQQLKERLMKYEGNQIVQKNPSNIKSNIVLCMFLFSVAFHLDSVKYPFTSRLQSNLLQEDPPKALNHHGRNLLWTSDDQVVEKNSSHFSPFTMCPATINQTESARLVLELERWIGKPKDDVPTQNNSISKVPKLRKRKMKKYEASLVSSFYDNRNVNNKKLSSNRELQVFLPSPEQLYSEFFEAINRQDDTFYVVSFSDHHMLLPALHHNKTRRPKMSLIMPSVLPTGNISQPTLVPLMQIDCEVLDTRLIQIRYGSIPKHLRKHGNMTSYQKPETVSKQDENTSNYTTRKAYKPYFIKQDPDVYNIH